MSQQTLHFSEILRDVLSITHARTLLLLNTCYEMDVVRDGCNEVIAAWARTDKYYDGTASFSNCLIRELRHAAARNEVLTVTQLYARLATHALVLDDPENTELPELPELPAHVVWDSTCRQSPIHLAPAASISRMITLWRPADDMCLRTHPVAVVVTVHLEGRPSTTGTLQALSRHSQSGLERTRVVTVVPSKYGYTVIMEVALDVWDRLSDNPAVSLVRFKIVPPGRPAPSIVRGLDRQQLAAGYLLIPFERRARLRYLENMFATTGRLPGIRSFHTA
jgi:hypothetical protein